MRFVLPWWKRWLVRRRYLPRMLRTRRFPAGARAPREIRPSDAPAAGEEAAARLCAAAAGIERFFSEHPRAARQRLAHPYFGAIPAAELFEVLTLHAVHHRGQIARSAS